MGHGTSVENLGMYGIKNILCLQLIGVRHWDRHRWHDFVFLATLLENVCHSLRCLRKAWPWKLPIIGFVVVALALWRKTSIPPTLLRRIWPWAFRKCWWPQYSPASWPVFLEETLPGGRVGCFWCAESVGCYLGALKAKWAAAKTSLCT